MSQFLVLMELILEIMAIIVKVEDVYAECNIVTLIFLNKR
jgi:hypothetical protein